MKLTDKELIELEALASKNPAVNKLLEEFKSYNRDVVKIYYLAYKNNIEQISNEIRDNQEAFKITNEKDDKGFERAFKYMEKTKDLIENLRYLEKQIKPEDFAEESTGGKTVSMTDKWANSKKNI